MDLAKKTKVNALFGFYGDLLTAKQREYLTDYFENDYSIIEIAEAEGVSRQAVSDNLKRGVEQLEHYEAGLHLCGDFAVRQSLEHRLASYVAQYHADDQQLQDLVAQLLNKEIDWKEPEQWLLKT